MGNVEKREHSKPVSVECGVRGQGLTDREKWLMQRAWTAAWTTGMNRTRNYSMQDWLNDSAADGVDIEMVLAKEAP